MLSLWQSTPSLAEQPVMAEHVGQADQLERSGSFRPSRFGGGYVLNPCPAATRCALRGLPRQQAEPRSGSRSRPAVPPKTHQRAQGERPGFAVIRLPQARSARPERRPVDMDRRRGRRTATTDRAGRRPNSRCPRQRLRSRRQAVGRLGELPQVRLHRPAPRLPPLQPPTPPWCIHRRLPGVPYEDPKTSAV